MAKSLDLSKMVSVTILMSYVAMVTLMSSVTMVGATLHNVIGPKEFCSYENFNVSCERDHVLVMATARYGRMRIGKCVTNNLGYLPCDKDVMDIMAKRCTGRRTCDISVSDPKLRAKKPCPNDVTWHLEVSYKCVPIMSPPSSQCHYSDYSNTNQPILVNSTHFVSSRNNPVGLGSSNMCPWKLTAKEGQTISVSVYNTLANDNSLDDQYQCMVLGRIKENNSPTTLNYCPKDADLSRNVLLYLSKTNSIELSLYSSSQQVPYLLQIDVEGCPNITAPPHATVKRTDDKIQVTCNNSADTWALVCKDNKWQGTLGNCTVVDNKQWAMPHIFQDGILIAVALGVALGIFLGGLLLVIVGSRMKRKQRQRLQQAAFADVADCDVTDHQVPQHYTSKSPGTATLSSNMEYTLSRGPDQFASLNECDRPYTYRKAPTYGGEMDHPKCCKSPYHPYETPTLT